MRIGVIGASGFLGSNLVRHLSLNSHLDVYPISRSKQHAHMQTDLLDAEKISKVIDSLDAVYYFAHQGAPNSPLGWIQEVESNLRPLMTFLEAVKLRKSRNNLKIIYASSGGAIYGRSTTLSPWKETDITVPLSAYGVTKLSAEHFLRLASIEGNVQTTLVRMSNPYGNHYYHRKEQGLVDVAVRKLLDNEPLTLYVPLSTIRDYIHIDDLNIALEKILGLNHSFEVLNLGSGQGTKLNEVISTIERHSNKKLQVIQAPSSNNNSIDWSILNIDKAKAKLDWAPGYYFDAGIQEYLSRKESSQA